MPTVPPHCLPWSPSSVVISPPSVILFAYLDSFLLCFVVELRIKASERDGSGENLVVVSSFVDFGGPELCGGVGRLGSLGFLEITGLSVG